MGVRHDKQAKQQPAWTLDYKDENGKRCRTRVHGTKSTVQIQYGLILKEVENENWDCYKVKVTCILRILLQGT